MLNNDLNQSKFSFPIVGMHCASCAKLIEKSLVELPGVRTASVNYAAERAYVESDNPLDTEVLKKAVAKTGYRALFAESKQSDTQENLNPDEEKEKIKKQELKLLKGRVIFSAILSTIIFIGSFPQWFSFIPKILTDPLLLMVLTTPVQFIAGREFYLSAWSGLKNRTANMDTLIALGTTAAYLFSAMGVLFPSLFSAYGIAEVMYFDTAAVIITLILLGRYLEAKAKMHSSDAIKKLMGLEAKTASVLIADNDPRLSQNQNGMIIKFLKKNYHEVNLIISEVQVGDFIRVKPGEKVPVDGEIIEGATSIDESMVTGESLPVDKVKGNNVIGSTINKSGSIVIKATKVGSETVLANIIKLVSEAQGSKAPMQRLADSVSAYFVPIVMMLSVVTFVAWYLAGSFSTGFTNMIATLVIACPCALGLATPTAIMVGVGKATEKGILIKDAASLEQAGKVGSIVFDKTGTLTQGKPRVQMLITNPKMRINENNLLMIAGSLEVSSEHSLAEAVLSFTREKNIALVKATAFRAISGLGVEGKINGIHYLLGNRKLMDKERVIYSDMEFEVQKLESEGNTVIYLAKRERSGKAKLLGVLAIADSLKESAAETIEELKARGIATWMITGDNNRVAWAIGEKLGIKNIYAEVLPEDKAGKVSRLKDESKQNKNGKTVAFVGDGVNDAPALASADVGIAMGTGTDVAMESASMTLLNPDLKAIVSAINLSKSTIRVIKQNLVWAFGYNVILIPVAMGVLYPLFGLLLNPALAAFAMAASSISVVGNSLRLKSIKIG